MPFNVSRFRTLFARLELLEWILWFGLGFWGLYNFVTNSHHVAGLIAVVCLSVGGFQLAAHRWAWAAGLAAWGFFSLLALTLCLTHDLTFWRIGGVVCAVWGLINHCRDRPRFLALPHSASGDGPDGNEGPKYSLVLWLREPLYLDASILGQIASRAFGLPFNEGDDCDCFVVGKETNHIMRVRDAWFLIHHWTRPYFDNPETVSDELRELRRAAAVRDHRAWFSVDFLRASGELPDAEIHALIGRMLAEVATADAEILAVFHPATGRVSPWEPSLRDKLTGEDPLSVFEEPVHVPVIQVASDSPAMAAAVAEARQRWPEFVTAFHAADDKERFSVKAPVTEAGRTEFIWIKVKAIAEDQIHGFLANDPVALGDLKLGSFVSVAVADLNDWICPDPSNPESPLGLFTLKAVHEAGRT